MRLMSSSRGRMPLPPSQPHAATSDAAPPAIPSFKNPRRSVSLSMRREPPPIPPTDHRPQARRVHEEYQQHMRDAESHEDPHDPEVPIPRRLESTEQRREPGELQRLVDGETGENREPAEQHHRRVGELLERVVLP